MPLIISFITRVEAGGSGRAVSEEKALAAMAKYRAAKEGDQPEYCINYKFDIVEFYPQNLWVKRGARTCPYWYRRPIYRRDENLSS